MDQVIVIDLYAQRQRVQEYVRDWSLDDILNWLKQFGEITEIIPGIEPTYGFRSVNGNVASFWFSDKNGIHILSV